MKGGGHRWGMLTRWRADALCADTDQHKEEEEKKKKPYFGVGDEPLLACRGVDMSVLGRALCMRVDVDKCKEKNQKKR